MSDIPSPLASTSSDSITALFEADPVTLDDAALMGLITELRRRRNAFTAEEAAKSLKPKSPRAKPSPVPAPLAAALDKPVTEVSLDDL